MRTIRIGTRGSALALWQANTVKAALEQEWPEYNFELKITHTKGDKILDVALSKIGDKGLFTKELEVELFAGEVDMAVHSLKDMPTVLPEGAKVGAILERGEFRDAVVSTNGKTIETLDETDVIATSSLRRKSMLLARNPNLNIVDIRGNVNTRLQKMENGHCNVMLMAGAGLLRLGLDRYITQLIDPNTVIPACGQGAVAIEIREDDAELTAIVGKINHPATARSVEAERTFLNRLEGGCQVPIGAFTTHNGNEITLEGFVASTDGKVMLRSKQTGTDAAALGISLATELYENGGKEVMEGLHE